MILTHYYHRDDPPFQTLSALSEPAALAVISRLRLSDRTGKVYRRFRYPQRYLRDRRNTEHWLKQSLIQADIQPVNPYPQYFVIGKSTWIEEGFENKSRKIEIPLSAFEAQQITFTYPDSMISYWLQTQTDKAFYHSEYHGKIFTTTEIVAAIAKNDWLDDLWKTEETRKYDIFVEAQVWDFTFST